MRGEKSAFLTIMGQILPSGAYRQWELGLSALSQDPKIRMSLACDLMKNSMSTGCILPV